MFDFYENLQKLILFGLLVFILVAVVYVVANIYRIIVDADARKTILTPDSAGRHPLVLIKTRIGTSIYDPNNTWGIHTVQKDGTITTVEAPDIALGRNERVEIARANANAMSPETVTDSRAWTWAPSNVSEDTRVGGASDEPTEASGEDEAPSTLPKLVDFFDVIENREPGHIIIGVDQDNQLIQLPLALLFHQLIGGMSGYGKSIYLRSLVLQLLMESETTNIQIGLADIENNTFPEFRGKEGVRWYAGSYSEIEQMTRSLLRELEERKLLYESFGAGTPKDIERYNVMARRENKPELPMIVVLYDEFTALMNRTQAVQKRIVSDIYQLALRARKYGIFLVLAGHSYKADVLDSTVVGQFSFNICFRVRTVHTSISVLGEGGAEHINEVGEALIRQKTGEISRIKALFLDDDALLDALDQLKSGNGDDIVPDLVKSVVIYCHKALGNKVLFKDVEAEFKKSNISRAQVLSALTWMDENDFVYRNERNGRVLNAKNEHVISIIDEAILNG